MFVCSIGCVYKGYCQQISGVHLSPACGIDGGEAGMTNHEWVTSDYWLTVSRTLTLSTLLTRTFVYLTCFSPYAAANAVMSSDVLVVLLSLFIDNRLLHPA